MKKKAKTKKVQSVPEILKLKKEFAAVFRVMHKMGWAEHGFGHCSVRVDDQNYLINQEGVFFNQVQPKNIVHIDQDGRSKDGKNPASFKTHKIFHLADSDNRFVLHSHYAPAVVMANLGRLCFLSQYEGMLGRVRFLKSPNSGLHEENFASMGIDQSGVKVVFCEQHGVYVFGQGLTEVFFRLYLVCRASEVVVMSSAFGNQQKTTLELGWPKEQSLNMFWENLKEQVS